MAAALFLKERSSQYANRRECQSRRANNEFPLPWVRRGFKTNIVHTVREVGFMDYEQIRQSAKMRLCRALSSAVLAPLQDGIEKVRGSTPLISTIENVRFAN